MSDPQRYRFVVSTAQEAVEVLRERFGEKARVISVRQIEGTGLTRFLQAPKLEIVAEVPRPRLRKPLPPRQKKRPPPAPRTPPSLWKSRPPPRP